MDRTVCITWVFLWRHITQVKVCNFFTLFQGLLGNYWDIHSYSFGKIYKRLKIHKNVNQDKIYWCENFLYSPRNYFMIILSNLPSPSFRNVILTHSFYSPIFWKKFLTSQYKTYNILCFHCIFLILNQEKKPWIFFFHSWYFVKKTWVIGTRK